MDTDSKFNKNITDSVMITLERNKHKEEAKKSGMFEIDFNPDKD